MIATSGDRGSGMEYEDDNQDVTPKPADAKSVSI